MTRRVPTRIRREGDSVFAGLRVLLGLALTGYGLLVILQVLAHDALLAGIASLVLGLVLLAPGLPALRSTRIVGTVDRRAPFVAAIGAVAVIGVIGYNLVASSGLILPEIGILAYGVALLFASRRLDARIGRTDVATLVGWSFPILLAPLLLFALNAVLSGPAGIVAGSAMEPVIFHSLVVPMAFSLDLIGTPAEIVGNNIIVGTATGKLALGIGLVCAGLYPMILFLGILGLHAWQERLPSRLFALYLGLGLVGLWVTNLFRMLVLVKVGEAYGGVTLQEVHAHIGWIVFAVFMMVFWLFVVRRIEGRARRQSRPMVPRASRFKGRPAQKIPSHSAPQMPKMSR